MFDSVCRFENLLDAAQKAARGKRGKHSTAAFEYRLADELLALQQELLHGRYRPGPYANFLIHDPKRRLISAAPFRDRVVHHALCNVIEPHFERRFIPDSYANRKGKGTHRAIQRLQAFARRYRFALRLDIVKYFAAIDHEILFRGLKRVVSDDDTLSLIRIVIASGDGISGQEAPSVLFPGDDLLALCRPRGLPIGNLTSQFWANCYLHPLDLFIKRELGWRGYVRYVDDLALFGDSKRALWRAKCAIVQRLAELRLRVHERSAQVVPVEQGVPWLGFVVYPDHRRVKARKVVGATRRLRSRYCQWRSGAISFADFDASVQGWINHVRYADSWGLREHVLRSFDLGPAFANTGEENRGRRCAAPGDQ